MIRELLVIFSTIAQVCLVLNILLWLWRFRFYSDTIKSIGPFIIVTLLIELSATYLTKQGIPNLFLLHIYTLLEFLAWSFFYYYLLKEKSYFQKLLPWFVGFISILIIANSIFLEDMNSFNSNAKTLVQLILITYAVLYLFNSFGKTDLTQNLPRSLILINFAVIFYYSGSLFIFMFSKLMTDHGVAQHLQHGFWTVNALIYVIFLTLIFISLWIVAFRKTKSL